MDLNQLPAELLLTVLRLLPLADIKTCRSVWRIPLIREYFFHELNLRWEAVQDIVNFLSSSNQDQSIEALEIVNMNISIIDPEIGKDTSWMKLLQGLLSRLPDLKALNLDISDKLWRNFYAQGEILEIPASVQKLSMHFYPLRNGENTFTTLNALRLPAKLNDLELAGFNNSGFHDEELPQAFLDTFSATIKKLTFPDDVRAYMYHIVVQKCSSLETFRAQFSPQGFNYRLPENWGQMETHLTHKVKYMDLTRTYRDFDSWHVYLDRLDSIEQVADLSRFNCLLELKIRTFYILNILEDPPDALCDRLPKQLEYLELCDVEEVLAVTHGDPSAMEPIKLLLTNKEFKAKIHLIFKETPPSYLFVLAIHDLYANGLEWRFDASVVRYPLCFAAECQHRESGGFCTTASVPADIAANQIIHPGCPQSAIYPVFHGMWMQKHPHALPVLEPAVASTYRVPREPDQAWILSSAAAGAYTEALRWWRSGAPRIVRPLISST